MSRILPLSAVAVLSAGVLVACSSIRPHGRTGDVTMGGQLEPRRPGSTASEGDIGGRGLASGAPTAVGGRAIVDARRVCRTASRPAGWIAIAYVSAGEGDCPTRAVSDSSARAAILTYYADRPRDATLDVCADERVPSGWTIDGAPAESSDACPGVERNGSSTHRIRRVR